MTHYILNIQVVDEFKYDPDKLDKIYIRYPKENQVNVSSLFDEFANHRTQVYIKEENETVSWTVFDNKSLIVMISNPIFGDYGEHNLTISIFDECYSRYFESSFVLDIHFPNPPTAVGSIVNVTAYQGQNKVELHIDEGIFYDEDDTFSVIIQCCNNLRISDDVSFNNLTLVNPSNNFDLKFNKNYIGKCESQLIAIDSLLQTAIIDFYVDVLKCPQAHCLYCNVPNLKDCTLCIKCFEIDGSTGACSMTQVYFGCCIIIVYVIIVLFAIIFTEHDLNASYIFLESITIYWMLFIVFENKAWYIKRYFDQLLAIITHFSSLIFPLFSWLIKTNKKSHIISSFLLNCCSILIVISIFLISFVFKKRISESNILSFIFRVKVILKYMFWSSTYILFCIFYEIIAFSGLISSRIFFISFYNIYINIIFTFYLLLCFIFLRKMIYLIQISSN